LQKKLKGAIQTSALTTCHRVQTVTVIDRLLILVYAIKRNNYSELYKGTHTLPCTRRQGRHSRSKETTDKQLE